MTKATVGYFEIPVVDLARAVDFYRHVFAVDLAISTIDGNEMALFPDAEQGAGNGALAKGDSYVPSLDGPRLYFAVDSIEATLAKAVDRGGTELYPKTAIGDLGFVAEFRDCEGNRIALSAAS